MAGGRRVTKEKTAPEAGVSRKKRRVECAITAQVAGLLCPLLFDWPSSPRRPTDRARNRLPQKLHSRKASIACLEQHLGRSSHRVGRASVVGQIFKGSIRGNVAKCMSDDRGHARRSGPATVASRPDSSTSSPVTSSVQVSAPEEAGLRVPAQQQARAPQQSGRQALLLTEWRVQHR